jgi:competence protein ComFC
MLKFFLDLIFPPHCVSCQAVGGYLCPDCYKLMDFFETALQADIKQPALDELHATTKFDGIAQEFVHLLKFGGVSDVAQTMARMMTQSVPIEVLRVTDFLTFVPLHPKRQRRRGFNQAELLAKQLGKYWGIPVLPTLKRVINTSPQAELDREQRLEHLKGAFEVEKNSAKTITGKQLILIDDVATTGSTLNEAAKMLKKQGSTRLTGVVFAHSQT